MPDNIQARANVGAGTDVLASKDISGVHFAKIIICDSTGAEVASGNPLPISSTALTALAAAIKNEDAVAADGDVGFAMFGVRRDSDTSTAADGDYSMFHLDENGRLKVATTQASFDLVQGNITATSQTVVCDVSRASNIMFHVTGTFSAHNCTFEGSIDSTNGTDGAWFAIQAVRSNANTIESTSGSLSAAPAYAWEASVNALKYVRVRATAHTSGTATWKFQRGTYATEPIPAAQISGTQPVSGTVTANTTMQNPTTSLATVTSTTAVVLKSSAGNLHSVVATNYSDGMRYLRFYNATSATTGSTASVMMIPIPPMSHVNFSYPPLGIRFGTGICYSVTSTPEDSSTSSIASGDVKLALSYV